MCQCFLSNALLTKPVKPAKLGSLGVLMQSPHAEQEHDRQCLFTYKGHWSSPGVLTSPPPTPHVPGAVPRTLLESLSLEVDAVVSFSLQMRKPRHGGPDPGTCHFTMHHTTRLSRWRDPPSAGCGAGLTLETRCSV